MSRYGPMRRMQNHKTRGKAQTPVPAEQNAAKEPAQPVIKSPKRSPGYYRYVLDLHKSVSSKFRDEETGSDEST